MGLMKSLYDDSDILLNTSIMSETVSVYVEDSLTVYENIFERLFEDEKYEIRDGVCCGDIKKLYEKYVEANDPNSKMFFILDLDFNIKKENQTENFVYLNKYCIENYLFSEDAIFECFRTNLRLEKDNSEIIDLKGFFNKCEEMFYELYIYFYLNAKLELYIPTCSGKSLSKYLINNKLEFSKAEYKKFIKDCENKINSLNLNFENELEKAKEEIENFYSKKMDLINGKYIFECLKIYLFEISEKIKRQKKQSPKIRLSTINIEDLKTSSSKVVDLEEFHFLKELFERYLESKK